MCEGLAVVKGTDRKRFHDSKIAARVLMFAETRDGHGRSFVRLCKELVVSIQYYGFRIAPWKNSTVYATLRSKNIILYYSSETFGGSGSGYSRSILRIHSPDSSGLRDNCAHKAYIASVSY